MHALIGFRPGRISVHDVGRRDEDMTGTGRQLFLRMAESVCWQYLSPRLSIMFVA